MLLGLFAILLIVWLVGFVLFHAAGALFHHLLVHGGDRTGGSFSNSTSSGGIFEPMSDPVTI
jgi:hypothetical protein